MQARLFMLPILCALVVSACAPGTPTASPAAQGQNAGQTQAARPPTRTLRMVLRAEPQALAGTVLIANGITNSTERRLFNAGLTIEEGDGTYHPYLAEALPQLDTDSWKVNSDGTMDTTWRLRQNLTWQDGAPLTADDFVFARKIYATPEFGTSGSAPHSLMTDVTAPDPQTVVIHWKQPYPDADKIEGFATLAFAPLPAHILEPLYEKDKDAFPRDPFWTTGFVSAGPFKVDNWVSGAFIDAVAFDGHALGRPKIDRMHITWNADFNATLASFLAGEADVPGDDSIRVDQGLILEQKWATSKGGTVDYRPQLPRLVQVQHRPEFANPPAVLDLRVRQALAMDIDKNAINASLFQGKALLSDSLIAPSLPYFPLVDQAVVKYPYDPQRAAQLLTDAGYAKDSSGSFSDQSGSHLSLEIRNIQSAQNDSERSIMADGWRRLGLEISEDVFTPDQTRDGETLGKFRSLSTTSAAVAPEGIILFDYTTKAISGPQNQWIGNNRGGWASPEYDQLINAWLTTLDPDQRHQQVAQAVRVLTGDLGFIPLYFNPGVIVSPAGLTGVGVKAPEVETTWNIYEWQWTQ